MKLQIEKAVYGGSCLAHQSEDAEAGKAVFVPFTLPGEIVQAHLMGEKSGFAEASLQQVLTASEDRVQARCTHFGECGGCQYQHANYSAQIKMKTAILQETLERAGLSELPEIQIHTGQPWEYRNRVRMRVAIVDSVFRVGYNRRSSNEFLPIQECPISAPLLWRAAAAIPQIASEDSLAGRWTQRVTEVEFFINEDEKKLQASLFLKKDQAGFKEFCDRMKDLIPELIGAGVFLLPSSGTQRRAQKPRSLSTWGAEGLSYRAADESYWISRGGFFQVNRSLMDELIHIVSSERQGTLAWDLYAGVGLFSRVLTRGFKLVVAVEVAGEDLARSFKGPGRHAVEATTLDFLRSAVIQRERPDLIVMDPPRAGIGAEVCVLLGRIAAPRIVYVSCDPVTLARDLKMLIDVGYTFEELHMVDMFPQTFHLETVVVLRK
ncbi:23S rRNA (uracil(1939)-C(5))-methyltransferase RlmD [Granulicella sp. L60]|uniref:23S rRNA (uracil(1939)-C(5))-methyltransferase RlmD n=1 Tax=Granulicella sp. L60 TaxID=1641866 RepID=UPI00131E2CC4|nr:23S rRNA (uracil(1939)-C(5))-methyltransferase RlmD [Granulicella sp. L60]